MPALPIQEKGYPFRGVRASGAVSAFPCDPRLAGAAPFLRQDHDGASRRAAAGRKLARVDLSGLFANRLDLPEAGNTLDPRRLPAAGGVGALTDADGQVLLIVCGLNLRRILIQRLTPSPGKRRIDYRAVARTLWWQPAGSAFETAWTHLQIARSLNPRGYRKELPFGPAWFARVDPAAEHPRWVVDRFAFAPQTVDVGPFRDRASCRRFVELLEDLFDLCRYHDTLRQAPHGQACAYKEMGQCPAPCDGSIRLDQYRRQIAASLEFARGESAEVLSHLEQTMTLAAAGLRFEQAARVRERLTRARRILAADGRIVRTPRQFRYLVVQRAVQSSRIQPFFVDRGRIERGETVPVKEVSSIAATWADKTLGSNAGAETADAVACSEGVWLVSSFLNKGDRAAGLFLHESQLSTPGKLCDLIAQRFSKRSAERRNRLSVDPREDAPLE